jgi:hypothetical protein
MAVASDSRDLFIGADNGSGRASTLMKISASEPRGDGHGRADALKPLNHPARQSGADGSDIK